MADIESLELQITGDARDAKAGLDALITTLDTLKLKTQGGCGLSAIATPIKNIAKASATLTGAEGTKLKSLADGLNALSNLGDLKLSSSVANQIAVIGTATRGLDGINFNKLTEFATAASSLSTVGKANLTSSLNQLERLPAVMEKLDKLDMNAFKTKINEVTAALKPLADEMQKVANGFSAFPDKIQKFMTASSNIPSGNKKSAESFTDLAAKVTGVIYGLKRLTTAVASWINKASEYRENMNLFSVSMGRYAESAMVYANQVSEAMGINPSDWIRSQGVFMTLATGFGIAGDRAAKMSEQLTQLGYDLSSFYNISVEEAMDKVKSGFSGELEPLRNLGYDLSKAKLEAVALSLGIDKSFDSMTQAEKASLRYYAIMTQVTQVQGDMADTLDEPANQLKILRAQVEMAAQAFGNVFIPILNKVLPYLIAFVQVVRMVANAIASLFGSELPEVAESTRSAAIGAGGISENLEEASGNASKLRKTLLGIDELNVMSDPSSGGGGVDVGGAGGGFDFDLPTYEFINEETKNRVNDIVDKMKEWLGITEEIGSWSDLFNTRLGNVLTLAALIGGVFAAWKISSSVITAIDALKSFSSSHSTAAGVAGGIVGAGMAALGLATIILELKENWEAIKEGDWSGVDKVLLAIGAIEVIGGLITAYASLSSIKKKADLGKAAETMTEVTTTTTTVSTTTSTLTSKLSTLAKDLALGIVIIAEVAAAALIIVGAIILLGMELEQVGIAWEPVIENGETVAIAMGIGTGILVAVGVAAALLGSLGKTLIVNLALGIAILAEIGAAALLFIAEIWAIGKGLDEIGKAWDPVLNNGENIATAIGIGTGLLVGIGVVTAALGAVTVASAGSLPLAIAIGTALLVELAAAFIAFTESLVAVAKELSDNLAPAMERLNTKLPDLSDDMSDFVEFMTEFADQVVKYTEVSAIAGLAGTVDTIIGWFTQDPITKLAKDVDKIYDQTSDLNEKLRKAVPELETACDLLKKYRKFLAELEELTNVDVSLSTGMFINMKEVGEKLVTGFVSGIESKSANFSNAAKTLVTGFKNTLSTQTDTCQSTITSWASKVVTWFTSSSYGAINQTAFQKYGREIVSGFAKGVTDNRSTATSAVDSLAEEIKKAFNDSVSYGNTISSTFVEVWSKVQSGAKDAWNGITQVFDKAASYFKTTFQNAWSGVTSVFSVNGSAFTGITNAIVASFKDIVNDLIRGINSVIKEPFKTINTAIRTLKYTKVNGTYPFLNMKEAVVPTIPYLAQGGIVNAGQLFVAREAGAELVGNVGRKTAVMNNDQIVDSVSRGVYQAVVAAMGSSRGDQVVEAKVNDKVLFEVMVSRARQETVRTGHNPLLGGA